MLIKPSTASSRLSFSSPWRHSSYFHTFAFDRSAALRKFSCDDAGADVGAADIDGEDRVVAPRTSTPARDAPRRPARPRSGSLRIMQISVLILSALSRTEARPIASSPTRLPAKPPPITIARRVLPPLELEKTPEHDRKLLREIRWRFG